MRSLAEIGFRLRQELANLWLCFRPPEWSQPLAGPLAGLPDPDRIAAVFPTLDGAPAYRAELETIAELLLSHHFPLLGLGPVHLPPPISWRRDFLHGQETGTAYFRKIPYLDFEQVGDHKIIWELNRHQHLVLLAQAFILTGRGEFLREIQLQLESWMEANPFQRGMNWTSALEVAFRSWSWIWVLHLAGRHFEESFRRRWLRCLYHHGLYLEYNLSFYFSPNTHLLGEAVMLHALGRLLPQIPRSAKWRRLGGSTVVEAMRRQVRDDGSHFEQSSYYHLYSVDFFLLHALLAQGEVPADYRDKLRRMGDFLQQLVSSEGLLPLLGDEDGGRLFHPYGDRRGFARSTLATYSCWMEEAPPEGVSAKDLLPQALWWLGPAAVNTPPRPAVHASPPGSRWFPDAGLFVLRSPVVQILFDVGPFGGGSAGHSHADTLALVVFRNGREMLIDPGTYTYIADAALRDQFRGTASHNTVSIDSIEQAEPQGPFRWIHPPEVELLDRGSTAEEDRVDACCRYRGFTHRRTVIFRKPDVLVVLDRISVSVPAVPSAGGPADAGHLVEQRWLCAHPEDTARINVWAGAREEVVGPVAGNVEDAQRSTALGSTEPATRRVIRYQGPLPAMLAATIQLGDQACPITGVHEQEGAVKVTVGDGEVIFPA